MRLSETTRIRSWDTLLTRDVMRFDLAVRSLAMVGVANVPEIPIAIGGCGDCGVAAVTCSSAWRECTAAAVRLTLSLRVVERNAAKPDWIVLIRKRCG